MIFALNSGNIVAVEFGMRSIHIDDVVQLKNVKHYGIQLQCLIVYSDTIIRPIMHFCIWYHLGPAWCVFVKISSVFA